jgi:hypothetical protein
MKQDRWPIYLNICLQALNRMKIGLSVSIPNAAPLRRCLRGEKAAALPGGRQVCEGRFGSYAGIPGSLPSRTPR